MSRRTLLCAAVCALLLLSFAGCPGGSTVVGEWLIEYLANCEGNSPLSLTLFVYATGTAEILFGAEHYTGLWTIEGDAFNANLSNGAGDIIVIIQATVSRNTMTNGTFSGDVAACFTGAKQF